METVNDRDLEPSKVVGRRPAAAREFGFEHLRGFTAMLDRLRAFDVMRPRGVFRFATLEEAQEWWEKTRTPRPREPRT